MIDNSMTNRRKRIGERIAMERKKRGWSQAVFGEKLSKKMGGSISAEQNTISNWEKGKNLPASLEVFLAISQIFECDCGYLLCDYDEKTHDSTEICKATGLSDCSVQCLCSLNTWEIVKYAKAIDFLLLDLQERYKSNDFRSVLDLLCFFLKYDDICDTKKQVFSDGHIADYAGGEISTDAIALNERIIENAALMEMEQALISLKKLLRKEQGSDGKH